MINIKPILGAGLTAQAGVLALQNVKLIYKKPTAKNIVKTGFTNIVGLSLIKAQGDIINTL